MSQFWLVCLFIHFGISEQQKNDENSALLVLIHDHSNEFVLGIYFVTIFAFYN